MKQINGIRLVNQNYYAIKVNVNTSKMMLFDSIGWHDKRLLVQHPPHRLTRVHGGNTNIVGSFASDPSDSFNGTTVISGIQLAGVADRPALRSMPSPLKRAAKIKAFLLIDYLFSFQNSVCDHSI